MSAFRHNTADLLWLSPGNFEVIECSLHHHMSEPFHLVAHLRGEAPINPYDLIYAPIRMVLKAGEKLAFDRPFSGLITKISQLRTGHGNLDTATSKSYVYEFEVRPKIWLLSKVERSRIYQHQSSRDIVTELLGESGVDHEWRIQGSPPKREYCVQYHETNLAFANRLLEEDGIYYYYNHRTGKTVFADHPGAHEPCQPNDRACYAELAAVKEKDDEILYSAHYEVSAGSGQVVCQDYNYASATSKLVNDGASGAPGGVGEVYLHNAGFSDSSGGQAMAAIRSEALASGTTTLSGQGNCRSFACGDTFQLEGHYVDELNATWVIRGLDLQMRQGAFTCHFRAFPASSRHRPSQTANRPKVYGLQTATIVGPPGTEVYLDDLGRAKIQFHWDREGGMNDRSSMWVRVSNNYAGPDYGIQFIPRVGHEVLVEFIEGNPDQPIVMGRVYNSGNTPPLGPPEKYQNTIKSIKDNHITLDDTDGKERLDIRAHKDMVTNVINHSDTTVGQNDSRGIGNDQATSIGNDQRYQVGHSQSVSVGNRQTIQVGVDRSLTVGEHHQIHIGSDEAFQIGENQTGSIGANRALSIGENHAREVGLNEGITVGNDRSMAVANDCTEAIGNDAVTTVGHDRVNTIGHDATDLIGNNQSVTVTKDRRDTVGNNHHQTVCENAVHLVGNNLVQTVGKAHSLNVGGMKSEKVAKASTETVGLAKSVTVGAAYGLQVGGAMNTAVGLLSTEQVGLMKMIKVGMRMTITCGAAKITINKAGKITISGTSVDVVSKGALKLKGTDVSIEASGHLGLKGAMIDIN